MKTNHLIAALVVAFCAGCGGPGSQHPLIHSRVLSNGLRVVVVNFPGSTNESVFSFLPLGLAADAPDQAQWSHLIEHLVLRSTVPVNSPQANAETLPDHLRLDFYGHTGNWQEGLSHHRRWLEGVPFTEANLAAEKPKVIAECDFTARNFATHKFAIAAWSQGFRHGRTNIALKGEVLRAKLAEVQRLRDERLVVSNRVTLCLVGGVAPAAAFAEVEKQLGGLNLPPPPESPAKTGLGKLDLTWDLDARHMLLTWPIPGFQHELNAALMVSARCLNMQLAADPDLARKVGMVFAGADLATPEGNFFFVSASLRPGSKFDEVRQAILGHVAKLSSDGADLSQVPLIARQLSAALAEVPDARLLQTQAPAGVTLAMLEANLGLQQGMHEHRFGAYRATLAQALSKVSAGEVRRAGSGYLAEPKTYVCTLSKISRAGN